ncbi:MAG TPA: hypothetical protein VF595_04670 [Tepidisphaeraceae bacterium]
MLPAATAVGVRRPWRGIVWVAAVVLIAAGLMAARSGWTIARTHTWMHVAPDAMVGWCVDSKDAVRARRAADVLLRRGRDAGPSDSTAASIAARIVAVQADRSRPWQPALGNLLESYRAQGRCPDALWRQYARKAPDPEATVRANVRAGDWVPFGLTLRSARLGDGSSRPVGMLGLYLAHRLVGYRVAGGELRPVEDLHVHYHGQAPLSFGGSSRYDEMRGLTLPADLPTGQINLTLVFEFIVHALDSTDRNEDRVHAGEELAAWQQDFACPVTVAPAGAETVAVVPASDPVLGPKMANALSLIGTNPDPNAPSLNAIVMRGKGSIGGFAVRSHSLPVAVAYDVSLRNRDSSEKYVGGLAIPAGSAKAVGVDFHESVLWAWTGDTLDIIFRPSRDEARRVLGINTLWGGEITLRDVPVVWLALPGKDIDRSEYPTTIGRLLDGRLISTLTPPPATAPVRRRVIEPGNPFVKPLRP